MKKISCNVLVIGGGAAGLAAAKTAHGFGKKVIIVEKKALGGECTWTGCVPSKALIKAAEVAYYQRHGARYGLENNTVESSGVMQMVSDRVDAVYQTHTPEKLQKLGIDVLFGDGSFTSASTFQLNDTVINFSKAILATGSAPAIPAIKGLDTIPYLTNNTLFKQPLPQSLLIIGGGVIGSEMASALNRLGVKVTILEAQDRILSREDKETTDILSHCMQREGVAIKTNMRIEEIKKRNGEIIVRAKDRSGTTQELYSEQLLIATGRNANLAGLGLEDIGVMCNEKSVVVNRYLQTTCPALYGAGDIVGPYQFSHMAWYQATTAARNVCLPFAKKSVDYSGVIWAIFTAPEFATIGLTEDQARSKYSNLQVHRLPYTAVDRPVIDQASQGMVKVITDKKGFILGAQIVGERAAEIIHELQLAKTKGIKFADLASVIHAYPTYCELVWRSAHKAYVDQLQRNIFVRLYRWFMRMR